MDATFIQLPTDMIEALDTAGAVWLHVHPEDAKVDDDIFVTHHPASTADGTLRVSGGRVVQVESVPGGLDYMLIKHNARTEAGSAGSPLVTIDGRLIGLHRCAFREENMKGATNAWCILKALMEHYRREGNPIGSSTKLMPASSEIAPKSIDEAATSCQIASTEISVGTTDTTVKTLQGNMSLDCIVCKCNPDGKKISDKYD